MFIIHINDCYFSFLGFNQEKTQVSIITSVWRRYIKLGQWQRKYETLRSSYIFMLFEVETLGPWGLSARSLYKESRRFFDATRGRKLSFSVVIQSAL